MTKFLKIGAIADTTAKAQKFLNILQDKYGIKNLVEMEIEDIRQNIDIIVTLGGDGFMLHCLHYFLKLNKPIYGMNSGNLGFLMNDFDDENFIKNINNAKKHKIYPLKMVTTNLLGKTQQVLGFNEISLFRGTNQAARLKIQINNKMRLKDFVGDGLIIATPTGSSAYNFSAGGALLPVSSNLIAVTPISPFRPRRWQGALLNNHSLIKISVQEPKKRPVNAVADFYEVQDVKEVEISYQNKIGLNILFNKEATLEEKILCEQFRN